jgi:hypothetical protein
MGLAISRSIVEAHGGKIWATPNGGGPGATMRFTIPAARGEARENNVTVGGLAAAADSSAGRERSSYERSMAPGGDRPQGDSIGDSIE